MQCNREQKIRSWDVYHFFRKTDYSYMRKKNENVALTLEERNIECANEWKTFGTIRNVSAPSTTQLSKIYANQKGRIQIRVCPDFGPLKVNEMGKMLAAMTKFRNVCAHNDRLVPVFEQKK